MKEPTNEQIKKLSSDLYIQFDDTNWGSYDNIAKEILTLRAQLDTAKKALDLAINTIECASIDFKTGEELSWYKAAQQALSQINKE